jgi:hemin uptake protein HemP
MIDSEKLFDGQKELIIAHRGEEYRLHLTKSGKLLLTK